MPPWSGGGEGLLAQLVAPYYESFTIHRAMLPDSKQPRSSDKGAGRERMRSDDLSRGFSFHGQPKGSSAQASRRAQRWCDLGEQVRQRRGRALVRQRKRLTAHADDEPLRGADICHRATHAAPEARGCGVPHLHGDTTPAG